MDNAQTRLTAAISEQKALHDAAIRRCMDLAGEIAVLRAELTAAHAKIDALTAETNRPTG